VAVKCREKKGKKKKKQRKEKKKAIKSNDKGTVTRVEKMRDA
jgi:hypothetical protein